MEAMYEQKLKKFSATVLKDAEVQRARIEAQIKREHDEFMNGKEVEFLAGAYENIQKNITRLQKEDNARVLQAQMESKRALLKKRERIIDEVFARAEDEIISYTKTKQYKTELAKKIEAALSELGEGEIELTLCRQDEDVFKKRYKAKLNTVSQKGFIGGVSAINISRDIAVDYSYFSLLSQQREEFLQKSGLSLS